MGWLGSMSEALPKWGDLFGLNPLQPALASTAGRAPEQEKQRMGNMLKRWDVTGKKQVQLVEYTLPELAQGDVHLQFLANGICGSDVHMFATGAVHSGHSGPHQPLTLGHELVAKVLAVGAGVTSLKAGDIVAVEPGLPCETCNNCKKGRYNCCSKTKYMGTPPQNGGLAHEFHWPARWCHRLPVGLSSNIELATLVEPLAACRQAWQLRSRLLPAGAVAGDEWTAITGSGAMAFGVLAIIKAMHPHEKVMVLARSAEDLEFAKKLGADAVLQLSQVNPSKLAEQVVAELSELYRTDHHDETPVDQESDTDAARLAAKKAAADAVRHARALGQHASEIETEMRKAALEAANRVLVAENTAVFKKAHAQCGGNISSLFECTGNERLFETIIATQFLLGGGCIIGLGCHYGVHFDVAHLRRLELAFMPVRRSCEQFQSTIDLLAGRPELFQQLIGHVATFEQFGDVLNGLTTGVATGTGGPKTVIKLSAV